MLKIDVASVNTLINEQHAAYFTTTIDSTIVITVSSEISITVAITKAKVRVYGRKFRKFKSHGD